MRQSKVPLIVSLLLVSGLSLANAAYDDPNVLSVEKEGVNLSPHIALKS